MKTSRTNSFRLHRIGKTNSVRKSSQTFYDADESFKLAALNSVSRGVKHADLSFMTGTNLNKLRVEPLESNEGFINSAHDNLTEVRKKYDQIKKQRIMIETKIEKMKEDSHKLETLENEYVDKISMAKTKAIQLEKSLKSKQSEAEDVFWQKKVLLSMQGRFKQDKIFYFQKQFDFSKELDYLKKQLNIFVKEGYDIGESGDRSNKVYEKLASELERERMEREEHIRNLQTMIDEKMQLQNHNQERQADLQEIAERAIQDKDLNEKQWRKIFLTHTFVNKMLRDKIEKEMEKFKTVEFAFKEIKTATGVTDAKALISKYLHKETVYGDYLGKIADNEKTIDFLKSEAERLIAETKTLQLEKEVLMSVKIKSQDLHDDVKFLEIYENKALTAESYSVKMVQWVTRQLKKLAAIDKKNGQGQSGKDSAVELFTKYLNVMSTQVDNLNKLDISNITEGDIGMKEIERVTRVAPKRSRKNSAGEEIFDVDEEETHSGTANEQNDIISNQREEIIRNNQKFMKDLKRRKEQEKKLLVEKKEPKVEKGPKVQIKKEQD